MRGGEPSSVADRQSLKDVLIVCERAREREREREREKKFGTMIELFEKSFSTRTLASELVIPFLDQKV